MSQKCQSLLLDRRGRQTAQVATLAHDFAGEHVIAEHFHPEDQLIFASRGVMTVRTKQGIWVVPPLRAVWIPAGTPHSVAILGPVSMRTLYFAPQFVRTESAKCFVMNVSPLLRELILHACKLPKLRKDEPVHRRIIEMIVDQLEANHSIPLQLPHPSDPRAMRIVQRCSPIPEKQGRWRRSARIVERASGRSNASSSPRPK
jgi:quercetin dioxygenase-like cupin family protein